MIYPIMEWLLHRIPDLKKRAYLAKYLVKVEVPAEIMAEDQIPDLYAQVNRIAARPGCTGQVAQSVAPLSEEPEVLVQYPPRPHTFMETDHEICTMVISPSHCFEKSSCQLLAKVWALSTG